MACEQFAVEASDNPTVGSWAGISIRSHPELRQGGRPLYTIIDQSLNAGCPWGRRQNLGQGFGRGPDAEGDSAANHQQLIFSGEGWGRTECLGPEAGIWAMFQTIPYRTFPLLNIIKVI